MHTPGPWYFGKWPERGSDGVLALGDGYDGFILSRSNIVGDYDSDIALVCAAPELLKALEQAYAALKHFAGEPFNAGDETTERSMALLYGLIESAIAKARGENNER